MPNLKKVPKFKSEKEERAFWAAHDSTDYVDYSKSWLVVFPQLKPPTETISLRLSKFLLDHTKNLANKRDVPYQTLMKVFLSERVEEEMGKTTKV